MRVVYQNPRRHPSKDEQDERHKCKTTEPGDAGEQHSGPKNSSPMTPTLAVVTTQFNFGNNGSFSDIELNILRPARKGTLLTTADIR